LAKQAALARRWSLIVNGQSLLPPFGGLGAPYGDQALLVVRSKSLPALPAACHLLPASFPSPTTAVGLHTSDFTLLLATVSTAEGSQ